MSLETISWPSALARIQWAQGEHVSLIGHTGCGKTTLAAQIIPMRRYIIVLATKPRDEVIDTMRAENRDFVIVNKWPPADHLERVIYWPKVDRIGDPQNLRPKVHDCLATVYYSGGWCLYIDEVRFIADQLKLKSDLDSLWLQGRAMGISLVAGTQRPAWVPLEMYSQATHLFLWQESDKRNLRRLGEIGGVDTDTIMRTVYNLPKYDVLYVNARTRDMFVTNVRNGVNGTGRSSQLRGKANRRGRGATFARNFTRKVI
jgi:energy-coupling factor transporter ATP-binding protein EcfA2